MKKFQKIYKFPAHSNDFASTCKLIKDYLERQNGKLIREESSLMTAGKHSDGLVFVIVYEVNPATKVTSEIVTTDYYICDADNNIFDVEEVTGYSSFFVLGGSEGDHVFSFQIKQTVRYVTE